MNLDILMGILRLKGLGAKGIWPLEKSKGVVLLGVGG